MRAIAPVLFCLLAVAGLAAGAKPKFNVSEIAGPSSGMIKCDLDGDGLQDIVLVDGLQLSIFYQDRAQGFTRKPQQTYRLAPRPCVVWAAKLGGPAESLLVMTSEGVTELCFTNRMAPPALRQIIRQSTIIPDASPSSNVICLTLSARTGGGWPLVLLPVADGIQVWQHLGQWRQAQFIGQCIDSRFSPWLTNPGYETSYALSFSLNDVHGDGRDDLMIRRAGHGRTNIYSLYPQETNGLFALKPAMVHADPLQANSWLCWTDLNRDGKVDLIKSRWLDEPSFVPGISSGKVLVGVYWANEQGRIPDQPQQVFRKSDWSAALPVVDLDGDGFPDLVLGYSQTDTREGLRKEVTAKQLDYTMRFYFGRPGLGFPKEADFQRDVVIHLNERELLMGLARREYFQHYVRFGGDFSGDGKADLLVRDHSDEISVYYFISREKGFSNRSDLEFRCPEQIEGWEAVDLNHDGISDLIVKLATQDVWRIFISQK